MAESCEAAHQALEDALVEVDEAHWGTRGDGEVLTDWMILYSHTDMSHEGMPTQLSHATSTKWPRHKVMGFLREALAYLEAEITAEVIADRNA